MLQVGRRHIELPAVIAVFRFKTHRGRLAGEAWVIQMPLAQIDIDRGLVEHALWGAHQPLRRFDALLLQELDGSVRRQMPALLVRGAEFQGGNQLTIAFKLRLREHAGCSTIRPMRGAWLRKSLECPVHGSRGDAIHLGHSGNLGGTLGTFGRQMIQPLPQVQEGVDRNHRMFHNGSPSRLARARYTDARPIPSRRAIAVAPSFSSTRRRRISAGSMDGLRPGYTPRALAAAMPSSCRSRRRFGLNSANTPRISRNAFPVALCGVFGRSV